MIIGRPLSIRDIKMKKYCPLLAVAIILSVFSSCSNGNSGSSDDFVVGIAWTGDVGSGSLNNVQITLDSLGVKNVLLPEVVDSLLPYSNGIINSDCIDENDILRQNYADIVKTRTYSHSNVTNAIKGVNAVIFPGGEDIAPTLYNTPEPWHGIAAEKDYNATRDISDYLLMTYCLDNEIPILAICRGSQMLGIVSKATVIQDIPEWFKQQGLEYNFEHRNEKAESESYRDYAPHTVNFTSGSILATLSESTVVDGCPSWHHQAIASVDGTNLVVSGTTVVSGIKMIEGIERSDKKLAVGIQYHPEAAYVKSVKKTGNAEQFMSKEQVATFFLNFIDRAKAL